MITIKEIKEIREKFDFTHVAIFGVSKDGQQHVATHGLTASNAEESATLGNSIKRELDWPAKLQNAQPLERICKNCDYYKYPSARDSQYGGTGKCQAEPKSISKNPEDRACRHFEAIV